MKQLLVTTILALTMAANTANANGFPNTKSGWDSAAQIVKSNLEKMKAAQ